MCVVVSVCALTYFLARAQTLPMADAEPNAIKQRCLPNYDLIKIWYLHWNENAIDYRVILIIYDGNLLRYATATYGNNFIKLRVGSFI